MLTAPVTGHRQIKTKSKGDRENMEQVSALPDVVEECSDDDDCVRTEVPGSRLQTPVREIPDKHPQNH